MKALEHSNQEIILKKNENQHHLNESDENTPKEIIENASSLLNQSLRQDLYSIHVAKRPKQLKPPMLYTPERSAV